MVRYGLLIQRNKLLASYRSTMPLPTTRSIAKLRGLKRRQGPEEEVVRRQSAAAIASMATSALPQATRRDSRLACRIVPTPGCGPTSNRGVCTDIPW